MLKPFISVIIPNRNGGTTLGRCLDAALASYYDAFEVIVVDDASTDNSLSIVKGFPCRIVPLTQHRGTAAARNAGARAARGSILFFTDADCLLARETLAIAAEALARTGPKSAVGGTYTALPDDRRFFSIFQSIFVHYGETRNPEHPDYLATHAFAITAQDFGASGGFSDDCRPILEDVEFSHRLRRLGYRLVMDPALQVRHIFNYSLGRSLANGAFKARHWTLYSIRNGDLHADSGTASLGLKLNAAVCAMALALLALFFATGNALCLAALAAALALDLYANRELLRAFHKHGGVRFGLAATAYYVLLYPLAVGAGALAGVAAYRRVGGDGV